MKHLVCILLSAFLLLTYASNTRAADAKNNYLILGPGSYSCQRIVSDLAHDAKDNNPASVIVYSNWLAGNLSAYNRGTQNTYSVLGKDNFTEAFAWTVQYCKDHPNTIYAGAVDALILKLKPHRYTALPKPADENSDNSDKDDGDDSDDESK